SFRTVTTTLREICLAGQRPLTRRRTHTKSAFYQEGNAHSRPVPSEKGAMGLFHLMTLTRSHLRHWLQLSSRSRFRTRSWNRRAKYPTRRHCRGVSVDLPRKQARSSCSCPLTSNRRHLQVRGANAQQISCCRGTMDQSPRRQLRSLVPAAAGLTVRR